MPEQDLLGKSPEVLKSRRYSLSMVKTYKRGNTTTNWINKTYPVTALSVDRQTSEPTADKTVFWNEAQTKLSCSLTWHRDENLDMSVTTGQQRELFLAGQSYRFHVNLLVYDVACKSLLSWSLINLQYSFASSGYAGSTLAMSSVPRSSTRVSSCTVMQKLRSFTSVPGMSRGEQTHSEVFYNWHFVTESIMEDIYRTYINGSWGWSWGLLVCKAVAHWRRGQNVPNARNYAQNYSATQGRWPHRDDSFNLSAALPLCSVLWQASCTKLSIYIKGLPLQDVADS
jgi:hypothetical protein